MFASEITRLRDPENIAGSDYRMLAEKISKVMTKMFCKPENGGNPFLFAISGPKPHILTNKFPFKVPDEHKTAFTDGNSFFWNPRFLKELTDEQVQVVMEHETYHVVFFHCHRDRNNPAKFGGQINRNVWNLALDIVVNATIEANRIKLNSKGNPWGGRLGTKLSYKQFLDYIDGTHKISGEGMVVVDPIKADAHPEKIYDEILERIKNSPNTCKTCGAWSPGGGKGDKGKGDNGDSGGGGVDESKDDGCGGVDESDGDGCGGGSGCGCKGDDDGRCPDCGSMPDFGGFDQHHVIDKSRDEVTGEVLKAAEYVKNVGRGDLPASIEGFLKELNFPTLSIHDIIIHSLARKSKEQGDNNDWTRYERRPMFIHGRDSSGKLVPLHKMYRPKKYEYTPKWCAMVDTSGSMSDDDIANGVKELQLVASINGSDGYIIPVDAQPYWDAVTKCDSTSEIKRMKVVGRGGTVFHQFFKELPNKLGTDFDIVIVITDGYIDVVSPNLAPNCDVLWVITSGFNEFCPPFGRKVHLK